MRRLWVLLAALVSACSTSHDPGPGPDAARPDAQRAIAPDAATDTPAILEDASSPPDAPPEVDAGFEDLGDPSCAPDGAPPARFRDLHARVIAPNGCGSTCHTPAGWHGSTTLDLSSAEVAYRSLVNVLGCDGVRDRVTPCEPEASTLSVVPSLREEPCAGRHTFAGGSVTADEAAEIDDWIRSGARW